MIKKSLLSGLLVLFPLTAFTCNLPPDEVLKIGCTYDCDFFYRFRVAMTAWGMGYKTQFVDLSRSTDIKTSLSQIDGVLIPGGADIDPKYYMDDVTPELRSYTKENLHLVNFSREGQKRDPFEYEVVKTYSQDPQFENLPLLGICRGFQMMSVAQGIPLYLDIKTELGIKNRYNRFDRIHVTSPDSLMASVYGPDSLKAFKYHHQGIRVPYYEKNAGLYPLTKITAYSHDRKIAEALEYTHRPALGVQYHPEKSFSAASVPVFRWFLKKACEYKTSPGKE